MDISLSRQTIAQAIKTRTDEISALQDALALLNNTYQAEFTSLLTAQKEANDKSAEVQVEKQKTMTAEAQAQTLLGQTEDLVIRAETAEKAANDAKDTIIQLTDDKAALIERAELAESKVSDVKDLVTAPETEITPGDVKDQIVELVTPSDNPPQE